MAISFLRIDDRLIHGQMAACWIGSSPCDGIIVVDDDAANNEIQKKVLLSILPSIKTWVFSIDTATEKLDKVIESQKKYYLIVRSASALVKLAEKVPQLIAVHKRVNVGPLSKRNDAIQVNKGQGIVPEEIPAFRQLKELGFSVEFRLLPDTTAVSWDSVAAKLPG
ncbi:PTS sugar transporter subunit IIB [Yersinia kristensenii]|uniref:PTS system mannose/fructose/N-acetylgalactosamine-transporter subunit IIB n=1 Tax=Yersinia kristensenii TaxID=28152 RepID=UPI0001A5502B|nr:PTS sugar transporter subunit IIB [Yersinia kristensenii]EEP89074.1 Pts system mannose-specific eiiab component (Eiiab-man) [Yersinia kristensenii ATCC 33638]MBW5823904.1 PTS sugar transporter subunit IIB [Yersinia kristensenii]PEH53287.1 PTS mannose/fructose/sorbose transporter subunit IIB [Yersinia kristensenii]SUP67024.1 PTS system mannose-specific transporter subunit IIAB [Yersinia kristensenii]